MTISIYLPNLVAFELFEIKRFEEWIFISKSYGMLDSLPYVTSYGSRSCRIYSLTLSAMLRYFQMFKWDKIGMVVHEKG